MFTNPTHPTCRRLAQQGGVTILVALSLLVFFTIIAVGMSRNSFRDIVISGTERQGSAVRNVADSGIEWGIFWLNPDSAGLAADESAAFLAMKKDLLEHPTKSGRLWDPITNAAFDPLDPPDPQPGNTFAMGSGVEAGFSFALTQMGKLAIADQSQWPSFRPATGERNLTAPDVWAIRSAALLQYGGATGITFRHAKEAWVSTDVR